MKQSLNLKTSQQLTLTPQLKQSLKLLHLSSIDLEQEIQLTLDANPLLERAEREQSEREATTPTNATENNIPQPISEAADPSYEIERTDHLSAEQDLTGQWEESFQPNRTNTSVGKTSHADSAAPEISQFVSKQETLFEHLDWQIQMTTLSEKDKLIARAILRCLNDDGYLTTELDEIVEMFEPELMVELDEVQAILSLIKTLEPNGVGARDLSERLMILLTQQSASSAFFQHAQHIIKQHMQLLATHNTASLKKELGIDDKTLSSSLALITSLNPRIANEFKDKPSDYIVPDVIVKKIKGKWTAGLNSDNHNKLRINETYANMLKSPIDDEGSEYIQQQLQQAKLFIKGLMSRYDTLLLVSQAIVERQQAFFEQGAALMQPMVLQDIAQTLDLHESTISRATSGKYLLSPRGVFELKYFFSSALNTTDGTASSSTAIRTLIKDMVHAESKSKPLSDSKIAKELEQQGHIVARRTVAKYRESMQIAPSSQRKSLT